MINDLRPLKNNKTHIRLANVIAIIRSLNVDPQHTSINLEISNGMTITYNWGNRNFSYSCRA